MSKKKDESETKNAQQKEDLTPWQKENMAYMQQQGEEPSWKPLLLKNEDEEEIEEPDTTEVSEPAEDAPTKEETPEEAPTEEPKKKKYKSFADRLPNVKKTRNKLLYRRLITIVSILSIGILIVLYFISPLSKLEKIKISGNQQVTSQQLIEASKLTLGESLWKQFRSKAQYEANMQKKIPRVKKASIRFSGLNHFVIQVTEYQVVALAAADKGYAPILENGKILSETVTENPTALPIFQNFKENELIKILLKEYEQLPKERQASIISIQYTPSKANQERVELHMADSNKVIINASQLASKMQYYEQVKAQMEEPGIIDMEVGIFSYTDKPEETAETNSSENLSENN